MGGGAVGCEGVFVGICARILLFVDAEDVFVWMFVFARAADFVDCIEQLVVGFAMIHACSFSVGSGVIVPPLPIFAFVFADELTGSGVIEDAVSVDGIT